MSKPVSQPAARSGNFTVRPNDPLMQHYGSVGISAVAAALAVRNQRSDVQKTNAAAQNRSKILAKR